MTEKNTEISNEELNQKSGVETGFEKSTEKGINVQDQVEALESPKLKAINYTIDSLKADRDMLIDLVGDGAKEAIKEKNEMITALENIINNKEFDKDIATKAINYGIVSLKKDRDMLKDIVGNDAKKTIKEKNEMIKTLQSIKL